MGNSFGVPPRLPWKDLTGHPVWQLLVKVDLFGTWLADTQTLASSLNFPLSIWETFRMGLFTSTEFNSFNCLLIEQLQDL